MAAYKKYLLISLVLLISACDSAGSSSEQVQSTTPTPTTSSTSTSTSVSSVPPIPGSSVKAFPGAQGFGANASGGRGGQVIAVTNLNVGGEGSLQAALNLSGPRVIIFQVSGVISGDVNILHGDVTIAGQTAPGAGITIHGRLECDFNNMPANIIVRHIRVRADHSTNPQVSSEQYDGIQCSRSSNLIFDHISVSGGVDETFDLFEADNVTVQWTSITRGDEGNGHNVGLISGPNGHNISIHHNLFAHNISRNPAIANGPSEIINNVHYNIRIGFVHNNPATGQFNIIGNYYKQGPNNELIPFFFDDENFGSGSPALSYFLGQNYIDDPDDFVGHLENPWLMPFVHSSFRFIDEGWDSSFARSNQAHNLASVPVQVSQAEDNYQRVLNQVGAFPRDLIEIENINEVRNRTGSWGNRLPDDLLAGLNPASPPMDTDNDGLPDSWEEENALSIFLIDSDTVMASGYTAIEEYINSLADNYINE